MTLEEREMGRWVEGQAVGWWYWNPASLVTLPEYEHGFVDMDMGMDMDMNKDLNMDMESKMDMDIDMYTYE
jgi:hypothetical protein